MKDIGLGILDPYTVVISLAVFVLANVIFGYPIPVDTTTTAQLFFSLVILTGYIYFARSLARFPILALKALIYINEKHKIFQFDLFRGIRVLIHFPFSKWERATAAISGLITSLTFTPFVFFFYWCYLVINFSGKAYEDIEPNSKLGKLTQNPLIRFFLSFLDRASILLIAFIAMIPTVQIYAQAIGAIGIFLMLVIFLLKGNFSALLTDELAKKLEEKLGIKKSDDEYEDEQVKDDDSYLRRGDDIKVAVSYCLICQKTCTADESGVLPKLCSLDCQQKWFVIWEKDWCIRNGLERQLINQLRHIGYENFEQIEQVIKQLENLKSHQAIWALLAITRDIDALPPQKYFKGCQEMVLYSLTFLVREKESALNILNACILDENIAVVRMVVHLLAEEVPLERIQATKIADHMESLLDKSDWDTVKMTAKMLGKLGRRAPLVRYVEAIAREEGNNDDPLRHFINILAEMRPPAVSALKRLQLNKNPNVRDITNYALLDLKYRLEKEDSSLINNPKSPIFDIQEPNLAIHNIKCPQCDHQISIYRLKNIYIVGQSKVALASILWLKPKLIIECFNCYQYIHIHFDKFSEPNLTKSDVEIMQQAYHHSLEQQRYGDPYEKKTPYSV